MGGTRVEFLGLAVGPRQHGTGRATTATGTIGGSLDLIYVAVASSNHSRAGSGRKRVDVRPNWKEKPGMPTDWQGRPAGEKWWPAGAWELRRHADDTKPLQAVHTGPC